MTFLELYLNNNHIKDTLHPDDFFCICHLKINIRHLKTGKNGLNKTSKQIFSWRFI